MDEIHYREYKILLRPEQFFTSERFAEYWRAISGIAVECGVKVSDQRHPLLRKVREVLFYDTRDYSLYGAGFILRKRTFYDNGWPRADHELTLKFRHPDRDAAAAVDVRSPVPAPADIKFKEELLPLKTEIGGVRSLFSHNCVLTSPNVVLEQSLRDVAKTFPALNQIERSKGAHIALVNDVAVEEIQVDPGHFDFGHDFTAKASIAIWRNRATERSLIGEFAFQVHFPRYDAVSRRALERALSFFRAAQTRAPDWVQLGTTKTAMVYGIGKRPVVSHE